MASVNIFILLGLVALGFLIPPEVVATKSSLGRDEALIVLVTDADQKLDQSIRDHMSISFDVNNDDYSEFIQRLRNTVRDSDSHGIPVLAPQRPETPENARWLDIRLVGGASSITLRLEQSNLYVRGYARSTDNFFWELTDTHLIPGSRDLLFSGSYSGGNGMVSTAGVSRRDLPLGRHSLENAIQTLARLDNPLGSNARVAARSLLVFMQMIAEAARFRTISEHISSNYWNQNGVRIDGRMEDMENGWGQLSTAVIQADRNPTNSTPLPNIPSDNPTQVYTFGQALAALGILVITRPRGGSRSAPDYGRCLMNLEYVRVNNIESSEHRAYQVFGTVTVDDGWYTQYFYRREKDQYETVRPTEFATLTDSGYSFPVSGMDALTINVTLYEGARFSSSDKIADGYVLWDRLRESVTFANYDKHLQRVVTGDFGDVTVGYSVLSNALGVTVQVILLEADGESPAQVYGKLTASQVLAGSTGLAPITLLDKSSSESLSVAKLQPIPLTRTVFAAAASTNFTVMADLWDYDYFSLDDNIAQGSADFTVRPGTQKLSIKGRYGEVQVVVTCA